MRYVPTDAPPAPSPPASATMQRVLHDLRTAAEQRAWVGLVTSGAAAGARPPATAAAPDGTREPLVGLLAELRAVTTRYVWGLRADGARPEEVLAQVKAFVREVMAAEGRPDLAAAHALTAQVVGWSIAAYYDQ